MNPFAFRLDPVLRVRDSERDQCRLRVAETLLDLQNVDQQIATINQELKQARAERSHLEGPVQVDRLLASDAYEAVLRERRHSHEGERATIVKTLDERRAALLAADRAVRSLELLRESDFAQYRAEQRRRETLEHDELASRGHSGS